MRLYLYIFMWIYTIPFSACSSDPCDANNHRAFPDYDFGSRNEKCAPMQSSLCDFYFKSDWYVVLNGTIINHCPSGFCGTTYPAWMQGSLPDKEEGIVNRTVYLKFNTNCHQENTTIMVKNCSTFNVFYFVQLRTCPMAYCFESALPCISPTTVVTTVSGKTVSSAETTTAGRQDTESTSVNPDEGKTLTKVIKSKDILIGVSVGTVGLIIGIGFAVFAVFYIKGRQPRKQLSDSRTCIANNTYENFANGQPKKIFLE